MYIPKRKKGNSKEKKITQTPLRINKMIGHNSESLDIY